MKLHVNTSDSNCLVTRRMWVIDLPLSPSRGDRSAFGIQVNLTCDHRIVYGTDAAEFMLTLKKVIEDPEQLAF
jgi:hypothetical protein